MTSTKVRQTEVEGTRVVAEQAGTGTDAVLCVHGLASQRAAVLPLARALAEEGLLALAPDLRGHGASEGQRGRINQQRALADLRAWRDVLADEGASVRAIAGHSLGGFWAMAAQRELEADLVAAVATPVSIRNELSPIEQAAYRIGAAVQRLSPWPLRIPYEVDLEDVLQTQEARQRAREIELVQEWLPLANAGDLLALDGTELAGDVEAASIVAHPAGDELVPEDSVRRLFQALPEPRTWMELDGPHECFFETGGQANAADLARELAGRLGP